MSHVAVPFEDAITDVTSGNQKISQTELTDSGALAVVDQGRQLIAGYTSRVNAAVHAPLPLIVFGDHTRAFKFLDMPFAMGADGTKVLQVREGFDPRYVFHYLRSVNIPGAGYSRHFKFLKQLEIPAPPLKDQQRISGILDAAESLGAQHRKVLIELDALGRSLFEEVANSATVRTRVGDVARTSSGGTPNRATKANFGGDIPWVKSGELHSGTILNTHETLSEQGLHSSSAKILPTGTILLAMYGATAGAVGQLGIAAATNQAICALSPTTEVDPAYLVAALRAQTKQLVARAAGGAQPNLSQGTIQDFSIPLAPMVAQRAFAAQLTRVHGARGRAQVALAAHDELFAALQYRAFRGEL